MPTLSYYYAFKTPFFDDIENKRDKNQINEWTVFRT
jgi:hypothetical protein